MVRKWDINNQQIRKQCIDEVLSRISEQADEEFGMIAVQEIIDIVATYIGPQAYNMGIEDAKKAIQVKLADLEVDLDLLHIKT